jgi:hypothetical protein
MDTIEKTQNQSGELVSRSLEYSKRLQRLNEIAVELLPSYGPYWHRHSVVTMRVEALARMLYYNSLYTKIINVPGVICEFGVQWGATLSQLINLRSIHEPFNYSRSIYGFDTFSGLKQVTQKDGILANEGDYSVVNKYEETLDEILSLLEADSPMNHLKKFELIKGDACLTIDTWLEKNPHAIISMAIFDMDIYEPTKVVLAKILPRLTKGSLLVFDELNYAAFPGETLAVNEVLGLNNIRLQRSPLQPHCAWAVFGE